MAAASKKRLREMEEMFAKRFERLRILREEKRAAELKQQLLQGKHGSHQEETKR
jgi:hypothetical protein